MKLFKLRKGNYARCLLKSFRIMKLSVVFSFLLAAQLYAGASYSQTTSLSLSLKNVTVEQALDQIEKETGFSFLFRDNTVDVNRIVNLKVNRGDINHILSQIFKNTNVEYQIVDKQIILSEKAMTASVQQQNRTITGIVTDNLGEPIIGANITIKGTTIGTVTDIDGNFSLEVPASATITISYIGYLTKDIPVGNNSRIAVKLAEDTQNLDEVVVVGYGVQKKSDLTGSVSNIKSEKLMERPATTVEQALAGRVAGVNVSTNSGRPGGRTSIQIRGYSSINATSNPLYVVDGVVWEGGGLDAINPNDIESIDVLKDASSTAIYGTRGSNGVIIVTTKKGKLGQKPTISYDANLSVSKLARKIDVLNAEEFMSVWDTGYKNAEKFDPEGWKSGKYTSFSPEYVREHYKVGNTYGNRELFDANGKPLYDTDWQDEATRVAISQNHNLSFTGGTEKTSYAAFLNYTDDQGILKSTYKKRFSGRLNLDTKVKDWLKVGTMLSFSDIRESFQDQEQGSGNIPRTMIETTPIIPVKWADGTFARPADFAGMEDADTPASLASELKWLNKSAVFNGNVYANITFMKGLEFKTTLGASNTDWHEFIFAPTTISLRTGMGKNKANVNSERRRFWQWENHLTYSTVIAEDHSINAMIGAEYQKYHRSRMEQTGADLSDDFFSWNNLGQAKTQSIASSYLGWQMESYFARINYNLKNRYLLTVTGRVDGSSKFGKNNKYAFFPSAALGWRVIDEAFMENTKDWMSNLKLRLSYGLTGNSDIGQYRSLAMLGSTTYTFGGERAPGMVIGELANPDLKWEKTEQWNVGVDMGVLDNRISMELDFFLKKTRDLLYEAPVPATSGKRAMMSNIGSMENKGIELTLNTVNIKTNDFQWSSSFNISFLKNEITQLGVNNEDKLVDPDFLGKNVILRVGEPVGSFWGYKLLGTWGTNEADEAAKYGKKPGDLKHEDLNHDNQINDADKQIIGRGTPDFYGTFNNYLQYKNFDFSLELQYSVGADVLNNTNHSSEDRTSIANSKKTVLNAWTEENQNTPIAQTRLASAGYTTLIDSHKVENGSFLRGKNISIGYSLPTTLINKIGFSKLRVSFSAQNFFLITSYSGYDPEVSTWDTGFSQNIQFYDYPKARSYTFGLSAIF